MKPKTLHELFRLRREKRRRSLGIVAERLRRVRGAGQARAGARG